VIDLRHGLRGVIDHRHAIAGNADDAVAVAVLVDRHRLLRQRIVDPFYEVERFREKGGRAEGRHRCNQHECVDEVLHELPLLTE